MTAPRPPANRAEVIELMVREIEPGLFHPDGTIIGGPNSVVTFTRRRSARILAALEASGVVLVPAEATGTMKCAGDATAGPLGCWRVMLAASPYAPEGE